MLVSIEWAGFQGRGKPCPYYIRLRSPILVEPLAGNSGSKSGSNICQ